MIDCCDTQFWMVVAGFVIAFILAFGIGANDVANSFGTSVGSKVLTLKQACILATIFEILGSILIGAKVSGTIRKGILDPKIFEGHELELMIGYVSALLGCCVWLILATILNYPVSGTHSIVGATVGMAIVSRGIKVIKWKEISKIVLSWFISPLLSGIVSLLMFVLIRKFILRADDPLKAGLRFLPFIYTVTIFVNLGGILESSPPLLGFDKIPWWGKAIIAIGISVVVYLAVWLIIVPFMKNKVKKQLTATKLFEEENERLNLSQIESENSDLKKNISTQVDYVTLIVARNNEDIRIQEKLEEENMRRRNELEDAKLTKSQTEMQPNIDYLPYNKDNSSHTIHTDHIQDFKKRGNRVRTITAPSSHIKDIFDYGDVNLTLRGYLHTIHSPAMRQQLNQKLQHQRSINSNQARDRLSITNSVGASQNPNATSLSQLFTKQVLPNEADSNKKDGQGTEMKRGRFNCEPVKFPNDTHELQVIPAISERSLAKDSIMEIDDEVNENILEFPAKKEKKQVVDAFAHSDPPEAAKLFSFLQVLTAVFGSFAHGGNDVSNAIGPLIGLYLIYQEGKIIDKSNTPEWILFYGGVGISVGLWILGRRVIKTIGEDLTKITASSGFVIELASAMTVLGASLLNIPVSTTHCKVGSVVFTGRIRSKESVDWSLFRNIIIAWIVTVPVTGSIAGACQYILKLIFVTN